MDEDKARVRLGKLLVKILYRVSRKNVYTFKKVTIIASISKIGLRFDSIDLKLDQDMKKVPLGFYQLSY